MTWTADQLRAEWDYRYAERLGILCEDQEPAPEQVKMARDEADRHVEGLLALSATAPAKDIA